MENLIFASISLLILLPLIYFLPIGLSVRGKLLVAFVAFFISLLGLLANAMMPFWQTVLIEIAVISIAAYLIFKKMGNLLYLSVEELDKQEELEDLKVVAVGIPDKYSYIAISDHAKDEFFDEEPAQLESSYINAKSKAEEDIIEDMDDLVVFADPAALSADLVEVTIHTNGEKSYLADMENYLIQEADEKRVEISSGETFVFAESEVAVSIEPIVEGAKEQSQESLDDETPTLTFKDMIFDEEEDFFNKNQKDFDLEEIPVLTK